MTARARIEAALVWLAVVVALAVTVTGCSGKQVVARSTTFVETAHGTLNGARDAFIEWDREHQLAIVEAAQSEEQARVHLATYRAKRQELWRAFQVAYGAVAAAAAAIPLAEAAVLPQRELIDLVSAAVTAVAKVKNAIDVITGEKP